MSHEARQPSRPVLPPPHEALGIEEGEQAPCLVIVAEAPRVTGANAKGNTVKVGAHVWGAHGPSATYVEFLRPSPAWAGFVDAMIPGASEEIDIDLLTCRSCHAVGTAVKWHPGRPWVEFSEFTQRPRGQQEGVRMVQEVKTRPSDLDWGCYVIFRSPVQGTIWGVVTEPDWEPDGSNKAAYGPGARERYVTPLRWDGRCIEALDIELIDVDQISTGLTPTHAEAAFAGGLPQDLEAVVRVLALAGTT